MDKLKVGILGLGRGFTHFRNFLALEEAEVIGACDRFPRLRERAEQHLTSVGATAPILPEFDDLLDLNPDAVVVATNGKLQVEHGCEAMRAGLPCAFGSAGGLYARRVYEFAADR